MAVTNAHSRRCRGPTTRADGGHAPRSAATPATARRAETKSYTVEVPETATLLDALDAVKDKRDGTLAYRKSLPDGGLRLVRHAHGRRRRAGLQDRR